MNKINELNIKINKAVISRISCELDFNTGEPTWSVIGKLVSTNNLPIADFCFSNQTWRDADKIEIPVQADMNARKLFEVFTPVILEKLGNMFKQLPAKI